MMSQKDTILVIIKDKESRLALQTILEDTYTIINASTAKEAMTELEEKTTKITAVLIDLMIPAREGFSFLAKFQEMKMANTIPSIAIVSEIDEKTEAEAFQLGAHDIIVRPFSPIIIKRRIENAIKLSETAAVINQIERDSLTGLYNMNFFTERVSKIIKENMTNKYLVIFANISRFKLVNELFGRAEGDRLLTFIGKTIAKTIGDNALSGYAGADNFYILMESEKFNEGILRKIVEELNNYPIHINIIMRFGIYNISNTLMPIETIYDRAKLAVDTFEGNYDAYITYYNESIREKLLREQMITNAMKKAIKEKQFVVYYQPKFDLTTEYVIGAEALVRWKQPEYGFLSPGEFIPIFEKNGFISELDYYVWEVVCQKIASWIETGHELIPISVNVSRVDLYNPKLPQVLFDLVNKYKIPIQYLHLEITETAYTDNTKQMIDLVNQIRELGFVIEMDDFGTGYSSLNMLSDLPIEILKLDMSFLRNNVGKSSGRSVIQFVINLAQWLGLFVVAEGVETQEQAIFLKNMGCDYAQGYYYSKPVTEADFEKLLLETQIAVLV
ncbi:two-component system response regulator [Anaerosporobacter sp.]|uniref:two-component system response regulator n=1 Tax=Anaerosporobacter sp. TaxID=1872529 RepID=UPI00286F57DC|nr:EAL domain-containing protein [Anaerosporobacter sp.]